MTEKLYDRKSFASKMANKRYDRELFETEMANKRYDRRLFDTEMANKRYDWESLGTEMANKRYDRKLVETEKANKRNDHKLCDSKMAQKCYNCTFFVILTTCCIIFLLYSLTSTFVCTMTSGILLLLLYKVLTRFRHDIDRSEHRITFSCISAVVALGVAVIATILEDGYTTKICYFNECCDNHWISPNITGLSLQLSQKLYGQHLVIGPVVKYLKDHIEGHPQKATVFSLHGPPGTGKNYLSRMVAENMYVKGMDSKYFHVLSATKDFPHEHMLETYKETLKLEIETAAKQCTRSIFVLDEMDSFLPGLIETVRPYIDYRQLLFFFLSNSGGEAISEKILMNRKQGRDRTKITLKEMEDVIRIALHNDTNGLMHSSIVKDNLITAYVPFLPLERVHVERCIVDGLFAKGFEHKVNRETVRAIADELPYFPSGTRFYSTTGCKHVMEKIDLIMQEDA